MPQESLTIFDLGWVAGLLEGEGCFGAYSDSRRPSTFSVKVQMESTDFDVVSKLNSLVPGRVWESNYPSKLKRFPNGKPSWRWQISDKKKVQSLLNQLKPHMSSQRILQIENVLSHCEYRFKKESNV